MPPGAEAVLPGLDLEIEQLDTGTARFDLTLVCSPDGLPWQPDGIQRDGPQVRAPVDARVRAARR